MQKGLLDWVRLSRVDSVGAKKGSALLDHFSDDPGAIFKAAKKDLLQVEGITLKIADDITKAQSIDIDKELRIMDSLGIRVITRLDNDFPESLKNIFSPPFMLYVKGALLPEDANSIAIVGTRRSSQYGQDNAERFGRELASRGYTITSGMALGIDTFAHRAAIKAGGRTIAVLGSGLNAVYPEENIRLFDEIAKNGACISEFSINKPPLKQNFPIRNRLVAGMSLGVVVIEAGERSGALITARMALDEGREVFSLPGRIDAEGSKGTLSLIKEGAKLIQNVDDIIDELEIGRPLSRKRHKAQSSARELKPELNGNQKDIFEILSDQPKHIDDIIAEVNLNPGDIAKALLELQIKGLVKEMPGKLFVKK